MKKEKICLKSDPGIVCREEDEDALLFNPQTGLVKILNRTGYVLWKLCDGTLTAEEIIAKMQEEYPAVPASELENDILIFFKTMKGLELIKERPL